MHPAMQCLLEGEGRTQCAWKQQDQLECWIAIRPKLSCMRCDCMSVCVLSGTNPLNFSSTSLSSLIGILFEASACVVRRLKKPPTMLRPTFLKLRELLKKTRSNHQKRVRGCLAWLFTPPSDFCPGIVLPKGQKLFGDSLQSSPRALQWANEESM